MAREKTRFSEHVNAMQDAIDTQVTPFVTQVTVSRLQAAEILGLSKTAVRIFERDGRLTALRGPRGEYRFARDEVIVLAKTRALEDSTKAQLEHVKKQLNAYTAAQFKKVAIRIKKGMALIDIAVDLEMLPSSVLACAHDFTRLSGGFVVSAEQAKRMRVRNGNAEDAIALVDRIWAAYQMECHRNKEMTEKETGGYAGMFLTSKERRDIEAAVGRRIKSPVDLWYAIFERALKGITPTQSGADPGTERLEGAPVSGAPGSAALTREPGP